jgi:hypothetical protein
MALVATGLEDEPGTSQIISGSSSPSSSDEDSLSQLLPSLRDWLITKLELDDLETSSVAKFLSKGDEVLEKMLIKELDGIDEYKLGWLLLEDIISRSLFKNFGLLRFQEKLFIRHLVVKFKKVLVELEFNVNVLWRKCGCVASI